MPQIRPSKFTDFNDQPLDEAYVYVYKVGGSYLDSAALLTLTDANTGAAISNPFRTNEYGYPKNSNGDQVNPIFVETEWAVRVESRNNVEVWTSPKQIADNLVDDTASPSVVDATFADLDDAKAANLTGLNTVFVQSLLSGWEGSAAGPLDGFYAHYDGSTGSPSSGDENQFFDSAGNGFTRDSFQRIDEQITSYLVALSDDLVTLSGVPANSTDLGTFTGTTIPDSSTNKEALQALETSLESASVEYVSTNGTRYREWSSGRVECWGKEHSALNGTTVTLPTTMPNTNYIIVGAYDDGNAGSRNALVFGTRTTTQFTLLSGAAAPATFSWYVISY